MSASMSESLEADLTCEDLLDCVYGLGDLAQATYLVLATNDEPLTIDAVADSVYRDRTTVYRAIKRLEEFGIVRQHQVNYEHGGYYFEYEAVDAAEVAREMQRTLDRWYATASTIIGEFETGADDDGQGDNADKHPDSVRPT